MTLAYPPASCLTCIKVASSSQSFANKHSFKGWSAPQSPYWEKAEPGERTMCRWFSQGRPRSVIPLRRPSRKRWVAQFMHRKPEAHTGMFQLSSFSKTTLGNWFPGLYLIHCRVVIITVALTIFPIYIYTKNVFILWDSNIFPSTLPQYFLLFSLFHFVAKF